MTGTVTSLWRHPIKGHGREEVQNASFRAGETMPGDRVWAIAHEASKADNSAWAAYFNFCVVSRNPALMALSAAYDETKGRVTLVHPEIAPLTFDPDTEADAFLAWVAPLVPEGRAQPKRIIKVPGRGMTDSDFPSVTLCNMASHRAVEQRVGQSLSIHRWRGNIWFDGLPLWEEFEWMDREIQIGEAVFLVREPTDRCNATAANPETGKSDIDVLGALSHWGHQDFSVRAEVIRSGLVHQGDEVKAL